MADFLYNTGSMNLWDGTHPFLTSTLKVMLVGSGYSPDRDDDVVDAGGANDALDHECSGAGYVGGFGGAGRKTLVSKTIVVDKANDRSNGDAADVLWTALGPLTPQPTQLLVIVEAGADDTNTRLISHHDFSVTTGGSDVTAQIADLIRLLTT